MNTHLNTKMNNIFGRVMSSTERNTSSAPSTVAGDHTLQEKSKSTAAPTFTQNNTGITPYLGLQARLSQVWINKWTVLLLLVLVRTLFTVESLHHGVRDAKVEALSACEKVESMGSALASMPHYMAQGVNELTASSIDKAVHGLLTMLTLSATGVEEIVVFVINTLTQTYLCLITLAVSGGLHVAVNVAEDVTSFLNKTIADVGTGITHDFNSFQSEMNKFTQILNKFPQLFGTDATIPQLNINGSLDGLSHITLPASINQGLDKLNSSIPTFADVNNITQIALRLPFEEVKKLLNDTYGGYALNRSLFPVPQKEAITFCTDNDDIDKFFEKIYDVGVAAKRIALAVLLILATIACVPMAYREFRRQRSNHNRAQIISKDNCDPMDAVYIVSRPYTATAGLSLADHVSDTRRKTIIRWTFAYATTVPALFVLSLGLAALFSCLCQFLIVRAVQQEVPELAYDVGQFAAKVVDKVNDASAHWSNGTNQVIVNMNNDLNKDVFHYVNVTTTALNNTLNVFVDETIKVLNTTFGGTVLYQPITEVFNCLIGLKIAGIEKALTWAQDHAYADFPLLPNNTFSLGAAASATNSSSASALLSNPAQSATDSVTTAVNWLITKMLSAIRQEAIIAGCLVLVYLLIVLIGIFRAIYLLMTPHKDEYKRDSKPMELRDLEPSAAPSTPPLRPFVLGAANPFTDSPPHYVSPMRAPPGGKNNNADFNAANTYRGQPYTLKPRPFPSIPLHIPGNGATSFPFRAQAQAQAQLQRAVNLQSSPQHTTTNTTPIDDTPMTDETDASEAHSKAQQQAQVPGQHQHLPIPLRQPPTITEAIFSLPQIQPQPQQSQPPQQPHHQTLPTALTIRAPPPAALAPSNTNAAEINTGFAGARQVGQALVRPGPKNVRVSSYADLRGAATFEGMGR